MASRKISKELQDTVQSNPDIKNVYFDESGRHYFYAHKLLSRTPSRDEDPEDVDIDLYGRGQFSHKQVIPGATNVDNLKEDVAKGVEDSKIVEKMSRKQILEADVTVKEESLASKILNSTPEEKGAILASLGISPEILSALKSVKTEPEEASKKESKKKADTTPPPPPPKAEDAPPPPPPGQ